ncbi:MAG: NAD(P)-dependent oxidoreductase [Chloroflexi bacterium]|nr:NAD(P)-dependent oxidoreductase [Chloroflexota bacterium]
MTRVGWLGLGAMGMPMARRLVGAGYTVTGFDPMPGARETFTSAGGVSVPTAAEACAGADLVFITVATPDQTMAAMFGPSGGASELQAGSTVIVMSTVGPAAVRELEQRLGGQGVRVLDAPMSGGVARAERGDLVVMVGGPRALFDSLAEELNALGSTVAYVGEQVGEGQALKLVNQLLAGVHIAAAAEALGFAAALGLDPRAAWEVVRHGAAGSFMLNDRGARMLDAEFEPVRSALDIFVKDMGLVVGAAKAHKLPTPLAAAAEQLYLAGSAEGLGRRDDSAVVTLFERWVGRSVSDKHEQHSDRQE